MFLVLEVSHGHNWTTEYTNTLTLDKVLCYHLFIIRDRQEGIKASMMPDVMTRQAPTGQPKVTETSLGGNMTRKTVSFSIGDLMQNSGIVNDINRMK